MRGVDPGRIASIRQRLLALRVARELVGARE